MLESLCLSDGKLTHSVRTISGHLAGLMWIHAFQKSGFSELALVDVLFLVLQPLNILTFVCGSYRNHDGYRLFFFLLLIVCRSDFNCEGNLQNIITYETNF